MHKWSLWVVVVATCGSGLASSSAAEAEQYCSAPKTGNQSSQRAAEGPNKLSQVELEATDRLQHPISSLVIGKGAIFERAAQLERAIDYLTSEFWVESGGGDERTNEFPFVGAGPWKLLAATAMYLLIVTHLLPRLMRHRKSEQAKRNSKRTFELKWPLRAYNLCMIVCNMYAFLHGARILNFGLSCFECNPVDGQDRSAQTMELLHFGWLFVASRLIEWLDTVFFVLRNRIRQVTKLHVFHHSFVPLIAWTYLKYNPTHAMAFFPLINSFVHAIMYTYYLLATFGPQVRPYLWWKRYLTSMQMLQFVLILIQLASIGLSSDERCRSLARGWILVAFVGASLFLWLFYLFYTETYNSLVKGDGKRSPQQDGKKPHPSKVREGSSKSLSQLVDDSLID